MSNTTSKRSDRLSLSNDCVADLRAGTETMGSGSASGSSTSSSSYYTSCTASGYYSSATCAGYAILRTLMK